MLATGYCRPKHAVKDASEPQRKALGPSHRPPTKRCRRLGSSFETGGYRPRDMPWSGCAWRGSRLVVIDQRIEPDLLNVERIETVRAFAAEPVLVSDPDWFKITLYL